MAGLLSDIVGMIDRAKQSAKANVGLLVRALLEPLVLELESCHCLIWVRLRSSLNHCHQVRCIEKQARIV